jgi:hypothetical protein
MLEFRSALISGRLTATENNVTCRRTQWPDTSGETFAQISPPPQAAPQGATARPQAFCSGVCTRLHGITFQKWVLLRWRHAVLSVCLSVCQLLRRCGQLTVTSLSVVSTQSSQLILCKIWGFRGRHYEECRLLGYKTPVRTSQQTHNVSATEPNQLMLCKIWGFHGGDYEECRLLGYKTPLRTSQETQYLSTTESSQLMLCKIWGFHGGDYEERRLMGCYTVWLL